MRRTILLTLAVMIGLCAKADPITKEQAIQKAAEFVAGRQGGTMPALNLVLQGRHVSTAKEGKAAPARDAFYYVFNNGGEKGFVVMAGDDCVDEVLGYSDNGSFDAENVPEVLQHWLDGYAKEIQWLRDNPDIAAEAKAAQKAKAAAAAAKTKNVVAPLIKTHWSQNAPYNNQCYVGNTQSVTGCVGTALAQVMNYYKYPTAATTAIPAYSNYSGLKSTTFDWANILDYYSGNGQETKAQTDAVSKLMLYCAKAVRTYFYGSSSYGYVMCIPSALSNYFGYKNNAIELWRENYTSTEWEEILLNELNNARPIIYQSLRYNNGGHAFIIDGYDGEDMYHINWGWGGFSDGYYKLSSLVPHTRGALSSNYGGYSIEHHAIVGISPTKVENAVPGQTGIAAIGMNLSDTSKNPISTGTYEIHKTLGLYGLYMYYSYSLRGTVPYDVGVGVFKGDQLLEVKLVKEGFKDATLSWNGSWFYLRGIGINLANGEYYIKGVEKPSGTNTWKKSMYADEHILKLTVKDRSATVTTPVDGSKSVLKITSVKQNFEQGSKVKHIRARVKNTGNKMTVNTTLYLFLGSSCKMYESLYVDPGEEKDVDFYFSANPGTYTLKIADNTRGNTPLYSNSEFSITDEFTLPTLTLVTSEIKNLADGKMLGRHIEGSIVLKNETKKEYNYCMTINYAINNGTRNMYTTTSEPVVIPAGATYLLPINFTLVPGDEFYVVVSDANKTFLQTKLATVVPAFEIWNGKGERTVAPISSSLTVPADAAAVNLEDVPNLAAVTIKPNSNPNTIYYINSNAAVPTVLKTKNVVKGGVASTIALVEGYDYYLPMAFNAQQISYSSTPTLTYDGKNGWSTIMLPFAVQTVTSAGKTVDWCHGASDTDKNFLVKRFVADTPTAVAFANVDKWMPGVPYLMAVPAGLVNKKMVMSAKNVAVVTTTDNVVKGDNFAFVGTSGAKSVNNPFVLSSKGNGFTRPKTATVKPASAYFLALSSAANKVVSLATPGGEVIAQPEPGDLDGDGKYTVDDVMGIILFISGEGNPDMNAAACDVNDDHDATISDVMIVIRKVLENK